MDKDFSSFRKAPFGGFNRKDVINYIEKMRNESFEYKKQVEETVKSLNEKIRELENAGLIMQQNEAETRSSQESAFDCADIGQATKHLKVVADELCKSLGDFMEKLTEKGLFDTASQQEEAEPAAESNQEEVLSFVDGILASISYLGSKEADAAPAELKTEKDKEADISEFLSGLSFLN